MTTILMKENNCTTEESANVLFREMEKVIQTERRLELNFSFVKNMNVLYLNASFGQLYTKYSEKVIEQYITCTNIPKEFEGIFVMVKKCSIDYRENEEYQQLVGMK